MASKFVLVDGNVLGYAAHSKKVIKNTEGMEVQAIHGALTRLRTIQMRYRDSAIWVLWDGRAQFRYDMLPSYKGNRDNTPEKTASRQAYKMQQPYIQQAITTLGVSQFRSNNHEADDLAGYMSQYLYKRNKRVVMVTGDHDWMQLVNILVSWIDPRKFNSSQCNYHNFQVTTGYKTTRQFLQGKALIGDPSDNINGINGIGKKGAIAILGTYGDVNLLLSQYQSEQIMPNDLPDHLKRYRMPLNNLCSDNGRAIFSRNMHLMDLREQDKKAIKSSIQQTKGNFSMYDFESVCLELGFNDFIRQQDLWKRSFEERDEP